MRHFQPLGQGEAAHHTVVDEPKATVGHHTKRERPHQVENKAEVVLVGGNLGVAYSDCQCLFWTMSSHDVARGGVSVIDAVEKQLRAVYSHELSTRSRSTLRPLVDGTSLKDSSETFGSSDRASHMLPVRKRKRAVKLPRSRPNQTPRAAAPSKSEERPQPTARAR